MDRAIEAAFAVLLFLSPALVLLVRGGTSACFTLLVILAFAESLRKRTNVLADLTEKPTLLYVVAMASWCIATLISQAAHASFALDAFDGPSRFLFAVPVYLMLRRLPVGRLTVLQYGVAAGGIAALVLAFVVPPGHDARLGNYFLDVIHFGDLALIVGMICLLSINWDRTDNWAVVGLKVAGFVGGIDAAIRSGTRGAWVAVPFIAVIWWVLAGNRLSRKATVLGGLGVVIACVALFLASTIFRDRLDETVSNLAALNHEQDSSLGGRLQIWHAAFHFFLQNPFFGIGPDRFKDMASTLASSGYLTPLAAQRYTGDVHNEVLSRAATLGVFGLASVLLIFFAPLGLFLRTAGSSDPATRAASMLGSAFVVAFFIFGMSIEIFSLKTTCTFYSLTVANLLAVTTHCGRKRAEPIMPAHEPDPAAA